MSRVLAPADQAQIEAWWTEFQAQPDQLPAGLELVHQRLIRVVGRAVLPSGLAVYIKAMRFPRPKDRWRYLCRRLPALQEARVLRWLKAHGVAAPEVIFAAGKRRGPWPHAAMLGTIALPVAEVAPSPAEVAVALRGVLDAKVFHPDFHPGNYLLGRDGTVAVLDMQSARIRPLGIAARGRRAMLVKLLASIDGDLSPWTAALVESGLLRPDQVPAFVAAGHGERRRHLGSRIARCMAESSQFRVRRRADGILYERREPPEALEWIEGGEELVRYWKGDRVLETLDGMEPCLAALFCPAVLSSAQHRLLVGGGSATLATRGPALLDGHRRYVEILNTEA